MRLRHIDLTRSIPPHDHPDVVTGGVYMLKSVVSQGVGFYITSGVATRHTFHGYTTLQFHLGSHLHQFDPPGHNHSRLVELWEVVDEEEFMPVIELEQMIRQRRRLQRQFRAYRRRQNA